MRRETFLVIIFHLFLIGSSFSQDYYNDEIDTQRSASIINDALNFDNLIPPSPEASSLGIYGNVPVSEYTGTPNISVPIWNIESGNLSLPISLSYNASGIKVKDVASRVGLGWSLNAGGVITRVINGVPDNYGDHGSCKYSDGLWFGGYDILPVGSSDNHTKDQPDKYYYNFAGYQGSFYIDHTNGYEIVNGGLNDLTIELNYIYFGDVPEKGEDCEKVEMHSFTATTPDGIQYTFAAKEISVKTDMNYLYKEDGTPQTSSFASFWSDAKRIIGTSAWYMTEIEHPVYGLISLEYETLDEIESEKSFNLLDTQDAPERSTADHLDDDCIICGTKSGTIQNTDITTGGTLAPQTKHWDAKVLSKITFSNGYAIFNSEERWDVDGDKKISSMDIYINGTLTRTFRFNQSYWVLPDAGNSYKMKRLKLDGIEELNHEGQSKSPLSHSFEYYDDIVQLPARDSYRIDAWGYYNGNSATSYIPKIYLYDSPVGERYSFLDRGIPTLQVYSGADRSSDELFMKANTLKKINYPTGGATEFEYEMHTFTHLGIEFSGGGLRIKKTKDIPKVSQSNSAIETVYTYEGAQGETTGRIIGLPQLAYLCRQPSTEYPNGEPMRLAHSSNGLGVVEGSHIGYKSVKKRVGSGNGYIMTEFTNPEDQPDIETEFVEGVDVYQEDVSNSCLPNLWQFDKWPFYPARSKHFRRGLTKNAYLYDESNNLISHESNDYEFLLKKSFSHKRVPSYCTSTDGSNCPPYGYEGGTIYMDYEKVCLTNREKNEYGVSQSVEYSYGSSHSNPITIKFSNEDGTSTIKRIKYVYDFKFDLEDHNIVNGVYVDPKVQALKQLYSEGRNLPIEVQTFRKSAFVNDYQLLSGNIIEYSVENGLAVPKAGYAFNRTQDLNLGTLDEKLSRLTEHGNWWKEYSYYETAIFEEYNDIGRHLSFKRSPKARLKSYVWNTITGDLLAQFQNAKPSEIAYSDFSEGSLDNINLASVFDLGDGRLNNKQALIPSSSSGETAWGPSIEIVPEGQSDKYIASAWVKIEEPTYNLNSAQLVISTFNPETEDHTVFPTGVDAWQSKPIQYQNGQWVLYEIEIDLEKIKEDSGYNGTLGLRFHVYGTGTNSSLQIDAISLRPSDSIISTYSYDERGRLSSISNNSGYLTSYLYDDFDRLILLKDDDQNILQLTNYNYTNHQ